MTSEDETRRRRFERAALPHLDAAYSFARWLVRDPADADDVTQEAMLRALRHIDGFRGEPGPGARAWLLAIVRNAAMTHLARRGAAPASLDDDDQLDGERLALAAPDEDPERRLVRLADAATLASLLAALPAPYREVVVLRDVEDLSYREIAQVIGAPIGTVMSRLARARAQLRAAWRAAEGA